MDLQYNTNGSLSILKRKTRKEKSFGTWTDAHYEKNEKAEKSVQGRTTG